MVLKIRKFIILHKLVIVIYKAFCLDVAQDRMNGALNENQICSLRFASLAR